MREGVDVFSSHFDVSLLSVFHTFFKAANSVSHVCGRKMFYLGPYVQK